MKPKIKFNIISVLVLCVSLIGATYTSAQVQIISSDVGTPHTHNPDKPCVPPGFYEKYDKEIADNVERLKAEGKLFSPLGMPPPPQKYDWPLTYETNFLGNDYFFIQNYVDHDTATGSISEYMCGTRSYDLQTGYDHQGTDICIGPYWWNMMDDMKVRIIAAAPGQIVGRRDGNFDRNCGFGGDTANSVTIQHEDGTRALYLHMKSGSVTSKGIGEFVTAGEFLGYVGSSGSSTNPHLHFEIRDSLNNFIDPWEGPCNPDIVQSLWNDQKPYPNSGIMSILTMWDNPTIPACPNPETVPLSNHFDQGAFVRVEIHLRDLIAGTNCQARIYTPSGSVLLTYNGAINSFAAGNWRGFTFNLPNNAPVGTYRIHVTYQGKQAAHYFTVGCPASYNLSGQIAGYKGYLTGANITSTHTMTGSVNNKIRYEAEGNIRLNVGFRATRGCSFTARIDECAENVALARVVSDVENKFSLKAAPSLVTEKTKLNLELVESGRVSITIYDLTGRKIKSVITEQTLDAGVHEFDLDVSEFPSGIYLCSALSGESKAQCKIVVQK